MAGFKKKFKKTGGDVDFAAYNKYMVEAVNCEKQKTVDGTIVGYWDLGRHKPQDAQYLRELTKQTQNENLEGAMDDLEEIALALKLPEDEVSHYKQLKMNDDGTVSCYVRTEKTFYDNKKLLENVDVYGYPQKSVDGFTLVVEFNDILVNKAQFFAPKDEYEEGDHNNKPYRLYFGRDWFDKEAEEGERSYVEPPFYLKHVYNDGAYGFAKTSNIHKMAEAADLLNDDGVFKPEDVTDLLGHTFNFPLRVFINDGGYLNENIKCGTQIPEKYAVAPLDPEDESIFGIDYAGDNDANALKELPEIIKRTIKRAENFEGSGIQKELLAMDGADKSSKVPNDSAEKCDSEDKEAKAEEDSGPELDADDFFEAVE